MEAIALFWGLPVAVKIILGIFALVIIFAIAKRFVKIAIYLATLAILIIVILKLLHIIE